MSGESSANSVSSRFRGYLPVVVDLETAGFNAQTDALLEIAVVFLDVNSEGKWFIADDLTRYIKPFEGANLNESSLEFTGIDPYHPFRQEIAIAEKEALQDVFRMVRAKIKLHECKRAILVGHNAAFDISFLNAAVARVNIKRNPFHPFLVHLTLSR